MKIFKHSCIVIILFCFCGCSRMRARKELQRLSQIEICIPADLEVYCEGRSVDTLTDGHIGAIKQIIYYDSTGCSSCQINRLAMTESLFMQDSTGRFTPILLFAPGKDQYGNVVKSLKEQAFPFPVFIDRTNEFIRRNDPILADTRFQSFLLDRNNRIVLIGNPLNGDAMWELFKSTLENMLAHDGEYVPENRRP